MSGRATNRQERLRETADWLNAIPIDSERQPMISDPDWVDPGLVDHEVVAIRTALTSGVDRVECFITRLPVMEAIMAQLSDEELTRVTFPGVESQVPGT